MQSYSLQIAEQDEKQQYKQELGLRKMLYKYQHENEQLRNQIKALTQRLQSILSDKDKEAKEAKEVIATPESKMQAAHEKYLNEQMSYYFKKIQEINGEIKGYRDQVNKDKENQYIHLSNILKDKQHKIEELRKKIQKFKLQMGEEMEPKEAFSKQKEGEQKYDEMEAQLNNDLLDLKRRVRDLERTRNNNLKKDINRHVQMVNLQTKTRKISNNDKSKQTIEIEEETGGPGKKGVWGLDLTEQNYRKISDEFQQLKKQKIALLNSIRTENNGLKEKLVRLKNEYIDISANGSNLNNSVNLSVSKLKQSAVMTPKERVKQALILPDIPVPLGNSAYQRKNDKNFVPKKAKIIQWNVNKNKKSMPGFSWNDQNCKSPITGINIWLDKQLIGLQFIHIMGETMQHLHSEGGESKKLIPIQYRLNSNDYLENVILVLSKNQNGQNSKQDGPSNMILGLQLISKNGRKDTFGLKVGSQGTQKFDFGIKNPQKPIYSFGSFTINSASHLSCINSLGFAII